MWKSTSSNRAKGLHPVEAEGSGRIAGLTPGEEVERIWIARAAGHVIEGGGEDQDRKDAAEFSGFGTAGVVEIKGAARADMLEDQGGEAAFLRIGDLRQVSRNHRQPWKTQPLLKPFWVGGIVGREKWYRFRDRVGAFWGKPLMPADPGERDSGEKLEEGAADHGGGGVGLAEGRSAMGEGVRRGGFRQAVQMRGDGETGP